MLPGLRTVRGVSEGEAGGRGDPIIYVDAPWARPRPEEICEQLPEIYDENGEIVDQWENLKWALEAMASTDPEWKDAHLIGKELERRKWSHDGKRHNGARNATYTAGDSIDHHELALIRRHLDEYFRREAIQRLGDGGEDIAVTGLPFALSEATRDAIRKRWPTHRDRRDTFLFTDAPVWLVDDHAEGRLRGIRRRSDGAIIYVVCVPGSTRRIGGREHPVPPIPQSDLLRAMFGTLCAEGATFSAPSTEVPAELRRMAVALEHRSREIAALEAAQQKRFVALDPGNPDPPPPEEVERIRPRYAGEQRRLRDLQIKQRDEQAVLASREQVLNLRGIAVDDLWSLAGAVADPDRRELRLPLLGAIDDRIQVHRPVGGNGCLPDKSPRFGFGFFFHDTEVGTRRGWAEGSYATAWQRHGAARIYQMLARMAVGQTVAQQGFNVRDYRPSLQRALGDGRPARVLSVQVPELLEKYMVVCHPLLPAEEVEPDGRFTQPPLDDQAVAALATARGWPESLLLRIRGLHLFGTTRFLYIPASATAELYAQARRHNRIRITAQQGRLLQTPRTAIDWTVEEGSARLVACAFCGSRRIRLPRLREATGGVCGKCRGDRNGVPWPRRFDLFLEP